MLFLVYLRLRLEAFWLLMQWVQVGLTFWNKVMWPDWKSMQTQIKIFALRDLSTIFKWDINVIFAIALLLWSVPFSRGFFSPNLKCWKSPKINTAQHPTPHPLSLHIPSGFECLVWKPWKISWRSALHGSSIAAKKCSTLKLAFFQSVASSVCLI